jgi:hypothetical protein
MVEQLPTPDEPPAESPATAPLPPRAPIPDRLWYFYVGALIVGGGGLLLTRSEIFPALMFLATLAYLGAQIGFRVAQIRWASLALTAQSERTRSVGGVIATAAALLLMCLSAFLFQPDPSGSASIVPPILAMLVGGAALLIGVTLNAPNPTAVQPAFAFGQASPFPGGYLFATTLGILLLFLEAEISGNGLKIDWLQGVSFWLQGLFFWGGVILVTVGLSGATGLAWLRRASQRLRARDPWWLAFALVVALALVVRVWGLESSLPTSIDDGINIPIMWPLLSDVPATGLITSADVSFTTQLYAQFLGISVRVFGYDLAGARMVDALFGTLGVIALFLLAGALFDRKLALIAALILATFPPHMHFSRLVLPHILDATFGTFALAFLARALRWNRRSDWVLAGVMLGLTQYNFEAGRLFFPPLVVLWLGLMALFNFKRFTQFGRGLGIFVMAALLIALPTYWAALERNISFTGRFGVSGVGLDYWAGLLGNTQAFFDRLVSPFLVFVHQPEMGMRYYGGTHPMVLEYVVPFFLLGFFYLLWWWRKPLILVSLWLVATAVGNLFMLETSNYTRFVVGMPAAALAIAVGIYYLVPMLFRARRRQLVNGITAVIVGTVCVGHTLYYFQDQLPTLLYEVRASAPYPDPIDAVLRIIKLPENTQAYMISENTVDPHTPEAIQALYLWGKPATLGLAVASTHQITPEFLNALAPDRSYAFFVEPGHPDVIALLKQAFVLDDPQDTAARQMPPNKGFVMYFAALAKQHPGAESR